MNASDAFHARRRACRRGVMISVHRGLWGPAPENSGAAIAAAGTYDIIEIDTQLARDGIPVVIHDPDLIRTAGIAMKVADTPHDELVQQTLLEGAGGRQAAMTDQRILSLPEALAAAGPDAYFDIDVKYPGEVEAVAAFLADKNLQAMGSLKVDTASPADIEQLQALQDRYGIMVMAKASLPLVGLEHIADLTRAGVAAAELWFDDLDQLAQACRIAGEDMAISTYTLDPVHCCGLCDARAARDPAAVWGPLREAGISIIMTDQARDLATYLEQ